MPDKITKVIKYRKLSLICVFISIPISIIGTYLRISVLAIIGATLLTIFIAISFIFWRCPYCKKRLPMRFNAKSNNDIDEIYVCPYCSTHFKG